MKPNKILLTLIAAALLPTFAYAATDLTSVGEESGPICIVTTKSLPSMHEIADPMEKRITELVNSTSDPVLASYYRDMYRATTSYSRVKFTVMLDPYLNALISALYGPEELERQKIC